MYKRSLHVFTTSNKMVLSLALIFRQFIPVSLETLVRDFPTFLKLGPGACMVKLGEKHLDQLDKV